MYMAPSTTSNDNYCSSIMIKMLFQFRMKKTFRQVTNLHKKKTAYVDAGDEGGVLLDINLYLKRESLPRLGRFNSRVPVERMLVQMDLGIEGFRMDNIVGTVMVFHMTGMTGSRVFFNVYFLDSVFHPMNLFLQIKSSKFHFRSSSYLFRNSVPGCISYPELHYNQLVKAADAACEMICRVASSHPSPR
jgi:hypothetical protein